MADTSMGLAVSSTIVPTMPGCTPAGGWNWTATVVRPPRTVGAPAAVGVPSPLAPEPKDGDRPGVRSAYRSSRPRVHTRVPMTARARMGAPMPPIQAAALAAGAAAEPTLVVAVALEHDGLHGVEGGGRVGGEHRHRVTTAEVGRGEGRRVTGPRRALGGRALRALEAGDLRRGVGRLDLDLHGRALGELVGAEDVVEELDGVGLVGARRGLPVGRDRVEHVVQRVADDVDLGAAGVFARRADADLLRRTVVADPEVVGGAGGARDLDVGQVEVAEAVRARRSTPSARRCCGRCRAAPPPPGSAR